MKPIEIFNGKTRKRLAFLQNAYNIQYTKKLNTIWTASFRLPYSDEKNVYCEPLNLVKIWEVSEGNKDKQVGLFRILPQEQNALGDPYIEYQLEHVLGTLMDDIMIGWHEVGNLGVSTGNVLSYILSKQSPEQRWVFRGCDYDHQYLYGWQNENLLSALLSVTKPFIETDFKWVFDTESFPWGISLKKTDTKPVADIRYRKNLTGFTRHVDPTKLVTRLYCYGYGQGDNKLTISSINNGLSYLDSSTIEKYGVISQVWTDERFTSEESLKATGSAILSKASHPIVTYEFDVATYGGTSFDIGDTIRVVHEDMDELMIVREFSKKDVSGSPKNGSAIFGEGTTDIGDSYSNLVEKQRINETYSQGSESIFTDSQSDNADDENPLELTFTIPDTVIHVNEILFSAKLTNFRAYSKGIQGGGATLTATQLDGRVDKTGEFDGGVEKTGEFDGGVEKVGESGGAVNKTGEENSISNSLGYPTYSSSIIYSGAQSPVLTGEQDHNHSLKIHFHEEDPHTHPLILKPHTHSIKLQPHTHPVKLNPHSHPLKIDPHTHQLIIDDHTHPIEYGIFQGPKATSMSIYLDGVLINTFNDTVTNLNLIASMVKNANGKVMRGNHTIRVLPNSLTRIECSFQIRLFTNSLGGNQY